MPQGSAWCHPHVPHFIYLFVLWLKIQMVSFLSSAYSVLFSQRFPVCSAGEEPACSAGDTGEVGSVLGLGRPPLGVKRQAAPVSSPGASQDTVAWWTAAQRVREPDSLSDHTQGSPMLLCPWKVTVTLISICFLHFVQSKTCKTLCNMLFIFLFITVPVICCSETNDSEA